MILPCNKNIPNAGMHTSEILVTIDFTVVSNDSDVQRHQYRGDFYNRFFLDDFYHVT
jgi:hypothetical protein